MPGPDPAGAHQDGPVELERVYGRPAHGGSADNAGGCRAPPEMVLPLLSARVEKGDHAARPRIAALDSRRLGVVAPEAAEAKVFNVVPAAERVRHDVIDSELVAR